MWSDWPNKTDAEAPGPAVGDGQTPQEAAGPSFSHLPKTRLENRIKNATFLGSVQAKDLARSNTTNQAERNATDQAESDAKDQAKDQATDQSTDQEEDGSRSDRLKTERRPE
jgi:hypothetical protein